MKRFYTQVAVARQDGGWQVTLDGRGIRTVRGSAQVVPTQALAEAMAGEWADQGDTIDTGRFVLRDYADYAIDMVRCDRQGIVDKLLGYAETDTLCYRADPGEPLFARQQERWEPVLTSFEGREGVQMTRASGIVHQPQSPATLATLRARLNALDDFALAGLEAMTALAASLCVGLSALGEDADHAALWDAANLEEDWQAELWGRDSEAEQRRAARTRDFMKAVQFAQLARAA